MKIYRCNKNILNWSEMPQINYKWKLPILVDINKNVLAGNSLKNVLPDNVYIVIYHYDNPTLKKALFNIESGVVAENSLERFQTIDSDLRKMFRKMNIKNSTGMTLFDCKDRTVISEENYIKREDSFIKDTHAGSKKEKTVIEEEFEIDEEIMKELL